MKKRFTEVLIVGFLRDADVRVIRFRGHLPKSAPENFGKVLPIAMTPPGGKGWGAVSTMSPRRGTIRGHGGPIPCTLVDSPTHMWSDA